MTSDNAASQEPTLFSAVLTPHRSLSRKGFRNLMLVIGGLSFGTGMYFLSKGAWPVFGFCGLEVLLVYWAFRINYRRARAYEQVTVTPSELTVRKVTHHGRIKEWTLNPLWVRLDRVVHAEFGIERLFLVSHGRRLTIAGIARTRRKGELCVGAQRRVGRGQARSDPDGDRLALRALIAETANAPSA